MTTLIDLVEEIISTEEWSYERLSSDELTVEIPGRWCDYSIHFYCQMDHQILHISSYIDLQVNKQDLPQTYELLSLINERLALGHFELSEDEILPCYRYTFMMMGNKMPKDTYLERLLEIALSECERFYPSFQFVIANGKTARQSIAVALLETEGEA